MPNENYFMGLDYGTQGVRCGIVDTGGNILAISEEKYETAHPQPGWAEQRPADWIASTETVIGTCLDEVGKEVFANVKGISICATSSTVIAMDAADKPLRDAILWMDVRAVAQAKRINGTGHKVLRYCGNEVSVEWIVPKMMWLRDNEPEIFEKSQRIVEQQDFINHYLTGRWCASISQATCKSNYVDGLGGFSEDYFHEIGFSEFFDKAELDIKRQGEAIGSIRPELAKRFGLDPGVNVYQGCLDAYVNMIGLGVCRPGGTGIVMGSSFVHLAIVDTPVFEDGIWGPYKDALTPGTYCLEGGQISAGSITKWFLKEFSVQGRNPYDVMAEEAARIPIGSDGVITLDFFQGNRTPYKDPMAKGMFYGLTLSHTRAHMYRSILEGIAFGTRNVLDTIENGISRITEIRGCGGVIRNGTWLKIIADVTGKPIVLTKHSDSAGALGCAIVAAVGYGAYGGFEDACDGMVQVTQVVEPSADANRQYTKSYQKYLAIYEYLKLMMRE
jgi:FGGY-family pentulose kinase